LAEAAAPAAADVVPVAAEAAVAVASRAGRLP